MPLLRINPMSAAMLTRRNGKPATRSARNMMPTIPETIMPINGTAFDTMRELQPEGESTGEGLADPHGGRRGSHEFDTILPDVG